METIDHFLELDIRSGKILTANLNERARQPAFKLTIDFGAEIGVKQSSAQLCENYTADSLVGEQVAALINVTPRRVAGFKSEVLVLAIVCSEHGTVLVQPSKPVNNGEKLA